MGKGSAVNVAEACDCGHHHQHSHEVAEACELPVLSDVPQATSPAPSDQHHICIGSHIFFVGDAPASLDALDLDAAFLFVAILPADSCEVSQLVDADHVRQSLGKFSCAAELRAHLGVYRI